MRRLFAALFWSAVLFALVMASLPQPPHLPGAPSDKLLHILAFVVLTALAALAYPRVRLLMIFLGLSLFGGLIELVQAIPAIHRDPNTTDWLADTLTTAVILSLIAVIRRWCGAVER